MSSSSELRQQLLELQNQRSVLEDEIEALNSQAKTGEQLVDHDGFPRADVDVYAISVARSQLSRKMNDYRSIMKQIETIMLSYHAMLKQQKADGTHSTLTSSTATTYLNSSAELGNKKPAIQLSSTTADFNSNSMAESETASRPRQYITTPTARSMDEPTEPFCRVNQVLDDSPAQVAGLNIGDLVVRIGSVTKRNYTPSAVAELMLQSEGLSVDFSVLRDGDPLLIKLTPQRWEGRGLLGCHLLEV